MATAPEVSAEDCQEVLVQASQFVRTAVVPRTGDPGRWARRRPVRSLSTSPGISRRGVRRNPARAAGNSCRGSVLAVDVKSFSDTERQDFLAETHVAVLSVDATDGRPPASVPIWYDYSPGGNVRIITGASSRKARLIERAGAVTLVVQREELPYQYVVMEGTVVDTTNPAPAALQESIAIRYLGEEGGRAFVRSMEGVEEVLFTIRPDRWLSADFSDEF